MMPAGAARRGDPRRARPARLLRLRRLPQHEIHRVALVRGDVDARARQHLVERAARQRAIARRARQRVHRGRREEHMVLGDIGDAARDKALDQGAHRLDMVGRPRLDGRRERPQRCDILVELALGRLGDPGDRLVERQIRKIALGAGVDLVVDVGDVAGVDYVVCAIEMPQQTEQHVEHDDRPRVADMGVVVDSRAADIESHRASVDRSEILLAAGQGVVKAQRHRTSRRGRRRDKTPSGTGRGDRFSKVLR